MIETYRIGYLPWHRIAGRWRVWRAGYGLRPDLGASLKRWPRDRWLRPWQAEWDGCRHAPRAWTRRGVTSKAIRWAAREVTVGAAR